jgi:hypothetical protein
MLRSTPNRSNAVQEALAGELRADVRPIGAHPVRQQPAASGAGDEEAVRLSPAPWLLNGDRVAGPTGSIRAVDGGHLVFRTLR